MQEGLLEAQGHEKLPALVQSRVAQIGAKPRFRKVQVDSWRLLLPGSKTPFAPSLNHFREFPTFGPLSQDGLVWRKKNFGQIAVRRGSYESLILG